VEMEEPSKSDNHNLQICFALKKNEDRRAISGVLGSSNGWLLHSSIDDWIQQIFGQHHWNGFLAYNDEIPDEITTKSSGSWDQFGHTKGLLVWNEQKVGWLIHSVPKWPHLDENQPFQLPHIPNPELKYGQSFILIIGDRNLLESLTSQIYCMEAQVYVKTPDAVTPLRFPEHLPNIFQLSDEIKHLAKGKGWVHDFYEVGLPLVVGNIPCAVESWMRPTPHHPELMPETELVKHVQAITWPRFGCEGQISYLEHEDHAKWAVSLEPSEPWVCIGDLNHMSFQSHRGGGGILISDSHMWSMFKQLVDADAQPISLENTQAPSEQLEPLVTSEQECLSDKTETPLCKCGQPSQIRTSKTEKNPNRDYFTCKNTKCGYFLWADTQSTQSHNVEKAVMNAVANTPDTPKCKCGNASILRTSHSEKNPDRDYFTCASTSAEKCSYFMWVDKLQEAPKKKAKAV